jgi:hypothetical protein
MKLRLISCLLALGALAAYVAPLAAAGGIGHP